MGPQYTKCVEAKDFTELNYAYIGLLLALTVGGIQFALVTAGLALGLPVPHSLKGSATS
jgi:hypothetical protein